MVFRLRRVTVLGYVSMQLVSKISNLCDPDPPTSQTDGQTDIQTDGRTDGRHAISIPRYALVHRAIKTLRLTLFELEPSPIAMVAYPEIKYFQCP